MKTDSNTNYPFTYTIANTNWNRYTINVPPVTTGTMATNTSAGVRIYWSLGVGSDYQGSAGSWTTSGGTKIGASGETALIGTNSATFHITGIQFEVSDNGTATDFEHRSYADELIRCARYYWKTLANNNEFFPGMGMADVDGNTVILNTQFPVRMRAAPSGVEQTGTASDYKIRRSTTQTCSSVPTFGHATVDQAATQFTKSSHGWGDGSAVRCLVELQMLILHGVLNYEV